MSDTFDENNNTVGGIPGLRNVKHIESIVDTLQKLNVFKTPIVDPAVERQQTLQEAAFLEGLPGLAPTDYAGQLAESSQMAKLQLGLALAQRGFGSMGAQPRPGEMAISTVGRELLSPLAGDAMTLGQQFYDRKLKLRTAEKAQEAALTQAALGRASQKRAAKAASEQQYRALAIELGKTNLTPVDDLERYVNGKWVPFIGFVDKTTGEYLTTDANNDLVKVPANELRKWRKPADPTKYEGVSIKDFSVDWVVRKNGMPTGEFEPRVLQRIIGLDTRNLEVVPGENVYAQGSDFTSPLTINVFEDGEWKGVRRPLPNVDYVTTADKAFERKESKTLYVKGKPSKQELTEISDLFGMAVKPGDQIIAQEWINKDNPRLKKFMYRNPESFESIVLTPNQAKRLLETKEPTLKPVGGEQVGTQIYGYSHDGESLKAILWEKGDEIYFRDAVTQKRLSDDVASEMWPSFKEDADVKRLGGVVKNQVKESIGLLTGLKENERKAFEENALKALDDDTIRGFLAISDPTQRRNEISQWLSTLPEVQPREVRADLPPEVKLDPRMRLLSTPSEQPGGAPTSLISSRTFYPYEEGETIQLGSGNIGGLDSPIPVAEGRAAKSYANAIKNDFKTIMRADLTPQDEDVLLFSRLWQHLPTVAGKVGKDTYRTDDWKKLFEAARSKYNAAGAAIKPASEIKYGRQEKTLADTAYAEMDALRDNAILLRNYKVFGSFPIGGNVERDIKTNTWLGELWERAVDDNGDPIKEGWVPTEQWALLAQKDENLTEGQRAQKELAFEWMKDQAEAHNRGVTDYAYSMNHFEQAAEVVSALARYRVNAFNMVQDSRPSDRDIMLILGMIPGETGDTETTAFNKIVELQRRHRKSLTRAITEYDLVKWSPEMMVYMDQLGRGFDSEAIRVPSETKKEQIMERTFRNSGSAIQRAANTMHQIIPGHRSGRVSPITGRMDERSVNRLYNLFLEAARSMYGMDRKTDLPRTDTAALEEMIRQGATIDMLSGVYDVRAGGGRATGIEQIGPRRFRFKNR